MEDDFDIRNFITELRKTQCYLKNEEKKRKHKAKKKMEKKLMLKKMKESLFAKIKPG